MAEEKRGALRSAPSESAVVTGGQPLVSSCLDSTVTKRRRSRYALRALLVVALGVCLVAASSASAFISTGPTGSTAWQWRNPTPQGSDVFATSFADANVGWAVGRGGVVLKTLNGGSTWAAQDAGASVDLNGVWAASATHVWVAGAAGTVRHSSDGGATWSTQTLPGTPAAVKAIAFYDTQKGVAVGDNHTTYYTSNGGASWTAGTNPVAGTLSLNAVAWADSTTVYAVGDSGTIIRSTTSGASYTAQSSGVTVALQGVSFAPGTTTGYVVGNAGTGSWTVRKTTNGTSWSALTSQQTVALYGVDCVDANTVAVTGASGAVWRSTNGGSTWTNQTVASMGAVNIRAISLPDATRAQLVGDAGFMASSSTGGSTWLTQMPGTTQNLNSVWFTGANHGVAVGAAGQILRTTDHGENWTAAVAGTGIYRSVMFVSPTTGWAVGDGGIIRKTTDGGVTWVAQASGTTSNLLAVWFVDANKGYAAGNSGVLRVTTNGGSTWTAATSGTNRNIQSLWFADANTGYLCGNNGVIRKTTNGGTAWTALTSGVNTTLYSIHGVSATNVWAAGASGTLVRTTNGGSGTWTNLTSTTGTTQTLNDVFFIDTNNGWIGGAFGIVKKSSNAGTSWTSQNAGLPTSTSDTNLQVRSFSAVDANSVFFVGDGGVVRHTSDSGASWRSLQRGATQTMGAVRFIDGNTGIAVGNAGTVLRTTDAGATWATHKPGTTANFNGLSMLPSGTGWAVGSGGAIRKSTDGGVNWVGQTSNTTNILTAVSAFNANSAIAVGVSGTIRYTTNGGTTWLTPTTIPTTAQVNGVWMTSATTAYAVTGYVAGSPNVIKTTNGGQTWTALTPALGFNSNLYHIMFTADPAVGYLCGDSGLICKTTDGGATWVRQTTPTTLQLRGISFANATSGWAVGTTGTLLRTADGGATWTLQQAGARSIGFNSVAFTDPDNGWIVGSGGTLLQTTDQSAPTSTLNVTPAQPDGQNTWYVTQPSVSVATNEPASSYYSWSSASGPFSSFGSAVAVPEGHSSLYYYSVDAGGSTEPVKLATFNTDYTAPSMPGTATVSWVTTDSARFEWGLSTDNGSGFDHYEVLLDGVVEQSLNLTSTTVLDLSPNTEYTVSVVGVDIAGNASAPTAVQFDTLDVDRTPLATQVSVTPMLPDGAAGWYLAAPAIRMSSTPSTIPADIRYSWTDIAGPYSSYATTLTAPEGANTLYFSAHDAAGLRHDEVTRTLDFAVDTQAPSTPVGLSLVGVPGTSTVEVDWTNSIDAASGVAGYDLYLNGTFAENTTSSQFAFVGLSPANTYDLTVVAIDVAGRRSAASSALQFTMEDVPRTPLSTSAAITPSSPDGQNGWYLSAPSVALASSPATVPANTFYAWGTQGPPWTAYTGALTPTAGTRTLWYYSVDQAGERDDETPKSTQIKVDLTAPTKPLGLLHGTATTSTVPLSWTPSTDLGESGVARYNVFVNSVLTTTTVNTSLTLRNLSPNTAYTISVLAVDNAGRQSLPSDPVFVQTPDLDRTPIATTLQISPAAPNGTNGWYKTQPQASFITSPVAAFVDTRYSVTSAAGPWTSVTTTITLTDGAGTMWYYSRDTSGQRNDEPVRSVPLKIDSQVPVAPATVTASSITTSSATIRWSAGTDAMSGVDHYEILLDGITIASTTSTQTVLTQLVDGRTYDVSVKTWDKAGLASAPSTTQQFTTALIDRTAPVSLATLDPVSPSGDNGWYKAASPTIAFSVQATISPSTVRHLYSWDSSEGPWIELPGGSTLSAPEGLSTLWYYAEDLTGFRDTETPKSLQLEVDMTPPSAPANLVAASVTTSTVELSWDPSTQGTSQLDRYEIYIGGSAVATSAGTTMTLSGLVPSSTVDISVVAVAESGLSSDASDPVEVTTFDVDRSPFFTTASLSFAPDGTNDWYVTTPTVTLQASPESLDAVTYYSWTSADGPWTTYAGPIEPPYGDNTLYFSTHDGSSYRAEEPTDTVRVKFDPFVPAAPVGPVAAEVKHDQVTLTWLPVMSLYAPIDHYEVWDDYVGSTTGTSYIVTGLEPEQTYPFSILAVNAAGSVSSMSTTISVTTSVTPLPEPPTGVLAVAPTGGSVVLNWDRAVDTVGGVSYGVWRSTDGVDYSKVATVAGTIDPTYTDIGLDSSTRYYYAVSTIDSRGEGSTSSTDTVMWPHIAPVTGGPERPSGLAAIEGSGTIALSWSPVPNPAVIGYEVTRADRSTGTVTTITVAPTISPSYVDATALNGERYWYAVRAVDDSGTVGQPSVETRALARGGYAGSNTHQNGGVMTNTCAACHAVHSAPAAPVAGMLYTVGGPNESNLCLACHTVNSGRAANETDAQVNDTLAISGHSMWTTDTPAATKTCLTCHRAHSNEITSTAGLLKVGSATRGTDVCYQCHGELSTLPYGNLEIFDTSGHASVVPSSGSEVSCSVCHESHTSRNEGMLRYSGYMVCMQCHTSASADPEQHDILTKLTMSDDSNSRHPLLPQDQVGGAAMQCQNCHNTHVTSHATPLVDPYDPGPNGAWSVLPGDQKSFCFRCHTSARSLPASTDTSPWASAVKARSGATTTTDIEGAYSANLHGGGARSASTTTTANLRADMGYLYDTTLDCNVCHDPHGTGNAFALSQTVKSADGNTQVDGAMVYTIPAGAIATDSPVGYDFRHFCNACHVFDPASHDPRASTDPSFSTAVVGDTDCRSCHNHMMAGDPGL